MADEVAMRNYLIQAHQAAIMMAQEIARHPTTCVIWLFGDECDCGGEFEWETTS